METIASNEWISCPMDLSDSSISSAIAETEYRIVSASSCIPPSRLCMNADCSSRELMRWRIIEIASSKCFPWAAMSVSNWSDIFETSAVTAFNPASVEPDELAVLIEFDSKAVTISLRFSSSA